MPEKGFCRDLGNEAFFPIVRRSLKPYLVSVIMVVAGALSLSFSPFLLGRLIDRLGSGAWNEIIPIIVVLGTLQVLASFLNSASARISAVRAEEISHELRAVLFETVFHQNEKHASIHLESRGRMLSLFNRDIEALWDLFGFAITDIIASIVMICTLGIVIFILSPEVGFLFVGIAVIFSFAYFQNGRRVRELFAAATPKFDQLVGLVNSLFDGYETVASFRRQTWAKSIMSDMSKRVTELASSAHRRVTNFTFITGAVNALGVVAVWAITIPDMMNGSADAISIGELVAILFYFSMISQPLETISAASKAISKGVVSLKRITVFEAEMRSNQAVNDPCNFEYDPKRITSVKGFILQANELQDSPIGTCGSILEPISLRLGIGEVLGIAGASGSGKSTLLRLFARLVPEKAPSILLENMPYCVISEDDFRKRVLYLPQFPAIFPVSLAENIFSDDIRVPVDQILESVDLASRASTFGDLHDLSSAGLSGGEMQRIAISRSLLRSPRLLIVDEPTSALDYANSHKVCGALIKHMRDLQGGMIVASHDPNVLRKCDRIIVIRDGEVADSGTFGYLVAESELFRSVIETTETHRT